MRANNCRRNCDNALVYDTTTYFDAVTVYNLIVLAQLRTYYDRVCARFEAMLDSTTWSDADRLRLEEASSYFSAEIRLRAEYSRRQGHWHPRRVITEEEEWAALDTCTSGNVAHTCVYGFAVTAFQRHGIDYDAYGLIDEGWGAFRPHDDMHLNCYAESFLALLTRNAKFDRQIYN